MEKKYELSHFVQFTEAAKEENREGEKAQENKEWKTANLANFLNYSRACLKKQKNTTAIHAQASQIPESACLLLNDKVS